MTHKLPVMLLHWAAKKKEINMQVPPLPHKNLLSLYNKSARQIICNIMIMLLKNVKMLILPLTK